MYFVKYHPLKERLRARSISDREALPYLIVFVGMTAMVGAIPLIDKYNVWDGVSAFLGIVTAIGGVLYAYRQNGGSAGYDLIQKYVVLGWVVTIRVLLAFIPTAIVLYIIGDMIGLMSRDATGPYDVVIVLLFEIFLYQRLGRHIGDTIGKSEDQVSHTTMEPGTGMGSMTDEGSTLHPISEIQGSHMKLIYPDLPRRYLATVIDMMFVLIMFILTSYLLQGDDTVMVRSRLLFILLFLFIYEPFCTSKLVTIGQWMMRIRVRNYKTLGKISIPAAYVRIFVKIVLGFISFLTIPLDSAKRGIHDMAVGSVVIVKEGS
jgi:uncharacterized RDD family membrane protein YckC